MQGKYLIGPRRAGGAVVDADRAILGAVCARGTLSGLPSGAVGASGTGLHSHVVVRLYGLHNQALFFEFVLQLGVCESGIPDLEAQLLTQSQATAEQQHKLCVPLHPYLSASQAVLYIPGICLRTL